MGPDWKQFVEELIHHFEMTFDDEFTGESIAKIIKEKEIQFLEKTLMKMDLEEGREI